MLATQKYKAKQQPDDRWIFQLIYPLMIFGVVHIGNDNPILRLLMMPSYYTDLLLAAVCTYGTGFYFRYLFRRMESRYNWEKGFQQRLLAQLQYGVLIPLLLILAIETTYLVGFLHIPLSEVSILYLEFPLIVIFLLIVNLLYFIIYYRKHHIRLIRELETQPSAPADAVLPAHSGSKTIQLPVSHIAYVIKQDRLTFLHTTCGEVYWHDLPLDKIRRELETQGFYQLNRQTIASRKSIRAYSATPTRKLAIELQPETKEPVYVSKAKATDFVRWFHRK